MDFLNISMLGGALANMWAKIISSFNGAIGNYAWSIILLTVVIKLVMLPLDFFNKKITRKNTIMQAKIQPELAKLQQKYGNDKNLYNQKVSELYKSNNYNVVGSWLFMLINLVLTLVIFISLFSGLNQMASSKIVEQYKTLENTYNTTYEQQIALSKTEEEAKLSANEAVVLKYKDIKYSWLWIDNVWKSDMPTNSIPTFSEFLNVAQKIEVDGETYTIKQLNEEKNSEIKAKLEDEYNKVMSPLRESVGKANGYLILLILTVVTAFVSQWLMQRKNKMATGMGTGKIMMFVLPLMLGFFALTYNAVFALYLLTSQLMALAFTPLIDLILDAMDKKQALKEEQKNMVSYRRVETTVDSKKNKKEGK